MSAAGSAPGIDERVTGSGTAARFSMLAALLVVTTASMVLSVSKTGDLLGTGCYLAAGADPFHDPFIVTIAISRLQAGATAACLARYEPAPPWWLAIIVPVVLLAAAGALFRVLPVWKGRRGRVVALGAADPAGEVFSALEQMTADAGLDRMPRFVVDPAAVSAGAVVFGTSRRPTVCLHGGLLARRVTDPAGFRAVLLHELAHLRNRDTTTTYATVTLWRAFLVLVVLPGAGLEIYLLVSTSWGNLGRPGLDFAPLLELALLGLMVLLVNLMRADILRTREIYADRTATSLGADLKAVMARAPVPATRKVPRMLGSVADPWRTHPGWELRQASLADPRALFDVPVLQMLLTGAAAAIIRSQLANSLATAGIDSQWATDAAAFASAALVTGPAGIALWRAVIHAVLTGRRIPSGGRAGLWLGAGMALGSLVSGDGTYRWFLPGRPEYLLLVVLAGMGFTWWVTQCAALWCGAWPGRWIRVPMTATLAAASLALTAWFTWWGTYGSAYTLGTPLAFALGGLSGPVKTLTVLEIWSDGSLNLAAVTTLWLVPLLAWTVRPSPWPPGWIRNAMPEDAAVTASHERPMPSLRPVLLAIAAGAAASLMIFIIATAWMHTERQSHAPPANLGSAYIGWLQVAWGAAPAVAATVSTVLARRYHLLLALAGAEAAAVAASVVLFTSASADGCIPGLAVLEPTCGWRPAVTFPLFNLLLDTVLVQGAVAAFVIAGIAAAIRRASGGASAHQARPQRTRDHQPDRLGTRRAGVVIACAAVLSTGITQQVYRTGQPGGTGTADQPAQLASAIGNTPVTAKVRLVQIVAWWADGGGALIDRFIAAASGFYNLAGESGSADSSLVEPFCRQFTAIARDAGKYFRIPDPQTQLQWQTLITQTQIAGTDCQRYVIDQSDPSQFNAANNAFIKAAEAGVAVESRISDLITPTAGGT